MFADYRRVSESAFRKLWLQLLPQILTAKPMTDLCWQCQHNMTLIYRCSNQPDADKSAKIRQQEEHLRVVQLERSLYNTIVKAAKDTAATHGLHQLSANKPCSRSMVMHYSFDYAQQVHLPSNPMQPGPLYFLVPRKCGLFGVCCEAIPKQINFLIDEAHLVSKGSNAVISFLDFFFARYGLGETDASLHCDNCAGQNNNRYMLWYCAWRVLNGQHRSISLNFLVAGHTKFAPDWCFGLLKQAFRRHDVSCLADLETVVDNSAEVNEAQREDGEKLVAVHDWQAHLGGNFKVLPGMKKYHHFRFHADSSGICFVKRTADDEEMAVNLLTTNIEAVHRNRPAVLLPAGLVNKRSGTCTGRSDSSAERAHRT